MENGVGPAGYWILVGELIAYGAKAEKVAPGMKSDKVGADGEERWSEGEKGVKHSQENC